MERGWKWRLWFLLVELNNDPDFNPYFAGWNRSNIPATSGVSIHHPSGDIKKISTFTQSLTSAGGLGFGNDNTTHWRVYWSNTVNGHGVTEGGSSGSQYITKMDWLLEILPEVHHIVMQPINLMYTESFGMGGIKWVIVILNLNHG